MIILIIILAVIALPLIIALFVKKQYTVEREITINKPKQTVFNYIRLLRNQDNFSKWATMDPNMKKSYSGTDGTVGFTSAWDSDDKSVGKGEQEIKSIMEGERVDYQIRFIKPFEGIAEAALVTNLAAENETNIKWVFNGKMKYPMNIMLLAMNMDKMIGNDLDTGLTNLKTLLEKQLN